MTFQPGIRVILCVWLLGQVGGVFAQNYDYDRGPKADDWLKKDLQIIEPLALTNPVGPIKEVWIVNQTWEKTLKGRPWTALSSWDETGRLNLDQTPLAIADYSWSKDSVLIKYRNLEASELNGTIQAKIDSRGFPLTADRINAYSDLLTRTKWTYDSAGNLLLFEVYDDLDNLLEVHNYTYYENSNKVKTIETMNDLLESRSYGFDQSGNCLYVTGDFESMTWVYDAKGRIKEIQKEESKDLGRNTLRWVLKYNGTTGFLDQIDYQQDKVKEIRSYSHNPKGKLIRKLITRGNQNFSTIYEYDSMGRLTKEEGEFYRITTIWDLVGNWTSQKYETRPKAGSPWELLKLTTREFDYFPAK